MAAVCFCCVGEFGGDGENVVFDGVEFGLCNFVFLAVALLVGGGKWCVSVWFATASGGAALWLGDGE